MEHTCNSSLENGVQKDFTNPFFVKKSLQLPCGAVLKNRFAKSAMSENMAQGFRPDQKFETLYSRWAQGGCGLLVTGNVMIDALHLGEPNNVVIDVDHVFKEELKRWSAAGSQNGTHLWMQLNHPGKQSPKFLNRSPVGPSAVPFQSALSKMFECPRALEENEILHIIDRFAFAANIAKECGFTGVQIHGAHGYLVSQFLSPLHNVRTDRWGGSLENRMRFVVEIYHAIRKSVGGEFPISIKLNSADFQKGGFTEEESIQVASKLSALGMDLIEISGGTYEAPEMTGATRQDKKQSTLQREAYFLQFCEQIRSKVKSPLMLTGGFRTLEGMEHALQSGACDVIGLARSIALVPDFPNRLMSGEAVQSEVKPISTGIRAIDQAVPLEIIWYTEQIHRMGRGKLPRATASALKTVFRMFLSLGIQALRKVRT